jgi:3-dehydroquinate synthase
VVERWGQDFSPEKDDLIVWEAKETAKNLATVEKLASELVVRGADRSSLLVAVGGGVTGDVVGFLASIYMRGIPFVQVPTTLVAQVDSSIGGKTGVDLPAGKNLVGTFYQPLWVAIDPEFLTTLPDHVVAEGMAEVIKTAWIGDAHLVEILESHRDEIKGRNLQILTEVVSRCARVKADIVMRDETEGGLRRVLNLGHTFGHAIEKASDYTISHGEAVAIGCVCAARLSLLLRKIDETIFCRLITLFETYGLPTMIPSELKTENIISALYADKKKKDKTLTFVLPLTPGGVELFKTDDLSVMKNVL